MSSKGKQYAALCEAIANGAEIQLKPSDTLDACGWISMTHDGWLNTIGHPEGELIICAEREITKVHAGADILAELRAIAAARAGREQLGEAA